MTNLPSDEAEWLISKAYLIKVSVYVCAKLFVGEYRGFSKASLNGDQDVFWQPNCRRVSCQNEAASPANG